jgi:signal transduction histidine kinase/ligand-binding sensor domain-containing protein
MISSLGRYALFAILLFSVQTTAQQRQVKFTPFVGSNGISLGKINGIARDKFGFLWFSDQSNRCIIRYDGTHMTRYQNDPKNPNSLGGFYPECLFADSAGNIWIGFYGMGFDKFDPFLNEFTHYRHKKDDPESLANDFVTAILIDHLGNIWIGNYGGVDLLDQKTGKFRHFSSKPGDTTSLSDNNVRAIYEDKEGDLWIGTGFAFDNSPGGGLNRFNRKTETFIRYMADPKNPYSLIDNKVRAIFEDSYGNFWVGTRGDGLHTLDRKTGRFTRYPYKPSKQDQLSRNEVIGRFDHITFITEDADKKIWIGTLSNGLSRYDPKSKEISRYGIKGDLSGTLKDSTSWWAQSTDEGLIWFSTQNANVFKIDVYNTIFSYTKIINTEGENRLNSFFEDDSSNLWMGTMSGLLKKDLKTGTTWRFVNDPANKNSISANRVNDIVKDAEGNMWIATNNGFNRYDVKTGNFNRYQLSQDNEQLSNAVTILYIDFNGEIWAGTVLKGLYKFNPESGNLVNYQNDPADIKTIGNNFVTVIAKDSTTGLWVGSGENGGLNRMDLQTGNFTHYLPGLTINAIYKDAVGDTWVASESGLFWYDRKSDVFNANIVENTGFSITGISSMIDDSQNNLWIAAESGIYKLNKKRNQVIRYGKDNGIRDADNLFVAGAALKKPNGEIFFGNFNGYFSFVPEKLENINGSTRLFFTNFWLNNTTIKAGYPELFEGSIITTGKINLKYDQNIFSFSAAVVDIRNSGGNIYYQLENFDNDWRLTASEERISYINVPSGKYILRIKTANISSGNWVEKRIEVIILPPWWKTWWAYMLYGLLMLSFVYLIDRIQRKRIIEKERRHSREKELEQAREIEQAYHKLKATQSQLVQSEKMASLGELTAGIAHEIQNPLNFVNNFAEVNKELVEEMKEEIKKGNYDVVKVIAEGIEDNSEKISEHGKRADSIVKSMLQHSRVSAGHKELTDINALADEYLRLTYHGIRAKDKSFNARIITEFDPSIGKINIIPQDIGRVLLNLINNAFYSVTEKQAKHDSGYEPTVKLSTRLIAASENSPIHKSANSLIITVGDNGSGIPQKVLSKIFQPFFTTKPAGQGTGLGLSLSYDIVKSHGGELKVETNVGEGSEFIIILPLG